MTAFGEPAFGPAVVKLVAAACLLTGLSFGLVLADVFADTARRVRVAAACVLAVLGVCCGWLAAAWGGF